MGKMNSRWAGEILQNVEDGVEMVYDELGRRQEEGDQEDDKIREDLLYQEPLTPAENIQYVSLIASAAVLRIHDILVWIRIRGDASDKWIRIRIRILLLSSLAFKMPTKN